MGQSFYDLLKDAAFAGGGGGSPAPAPVLIEKSVTQNGTYTASDDEADGYSAVTVNVPNTYAAGDEGKVVQNGALVSQTSTSVSQNGTINTTTNNSVTVAVPNTYTASDEGKVVSNGALVAQGSDTVTENGTVDTTLISSLLVNVAGGGSVDVVELSPVSPEGQYNRCNVYACNLTTTSILVWGVVNIQKQSSTSFEVSFAFPDGFIPAATGGNLYGASRVKGESQSDRPRPYPYSNNQVITGTLVRFKSGSFEGLNSSSAGKDIVFILMCEQS